MVYTTANTFNALNIRAYEVASTAFKKNANGVADVVQLRLNTDNRASSLKNIACDGYWKDYITCYVDRKD